MSQLVITDKATPMIPDGARIMALTIWGEARGEGFQGRCAVGHVILNRVRKGGWWGNTVEEVCLKPWQFSCWNKGDPNREAMEKLPVSDPLYLQCLGISIMLMSGLENGFRSSDFKPDFPKNIYHYCTHGAAKRNPPSWAKDRMHDFSIGGHRFFSGVE